MISQKDSALHLVCVGAVYIDTILTVPHFPIEDDKLRAKKRTKRRGGNTANSLEVLAQFTKNFQSPQSTQLNLHLISVLPDKKSDAAIFVAASLPHVELSQSCIFRAGESEAASSYIFQNEQNYSRTIVSVNELDEMTAVEFAEKLDLFPFVNTTEANSRGWVHFEGRIPEVLLDCVQHIRSKQNGEDIKISVECEKPERVLMAEVATYADVVFYSKIWAEKNGFKSAEDFLDSQLRETRHGALLCCTWGASGATAVQKSGTRSNQCTEWATASSWHPENIHGSPMDSIGAGDTFIAGMLYALNNSQDWPLQKKVDFAAELAGRKVYQSGFGGLGEQMLEYF